MNKKIGVGVIGLGGRGLYLGKAFNEEPRSRLIAACDIKQKKIDKAEELYNDPQVRYYTDLKEFLSDKDLDAVVIATDDRTHGWVGLEVLKAKKHLFLEKPMAQTIRECDDMIIEWKKSGKVFLIGLELRYCSLCQEMKKLLNDGVVGDVKLAYAVDNVSVGGNYYFHDDRSNKDYIVSLVLEKGTHTLDLMNWFIDASPVQAYSDGGLDVFGGNERSDKRCRSCDKNETCPYFVSEEFIMDYGQVLYDKDDLCVYRDKCDVHDNSIVVVKYDNGAKLSYMECHFTPDYSREFTLIGTKGRMYGFYNNEQEFRIELTYRHSDKKDVKYPPKIYGGHGGGDPKIQKEFLDRIEKGIVSCPGVIGGRNSAAIAIAGAESAEKGMPVDIPKCPIEKEE